MTQPRWLFGSSCLTILTDRTTTRGQYDLIETYFLADKRSPLHHHTRYSEHLYVLEGEFPVWAGENKVVLNAGDRFLIPVGIPHTVGVLNNCPADGLVLSPSSSPCKTPLNFFN
ncbi:hypothetical protein A6770_30315 [Nostoc minutum NIES-26]|uniref:Cupin type-2 domain-containing protein n=1 Tax=Nostoc minutum NIES-26 TaxID=1844469 RepID=A0A367QB72_9NOSO|nr:hypothetical protein A6770_30315 [Nostoc minutum NIES-26]